MLTTGAAAGFYEATAQILPVFLLVMMVGDARLGSSGTVSPSDLWFRLIAFLGTLGVVLAGEVAALMVIGGGETSLLRALTCSGVALGIGHLMMQFLFRVLRDHRKHFSPEARDRQARLVLVLTLVIAVGTYAALSLGTG